MLRGVNKRGQLAVFIIIAIVIIGSLGAYFIFSGKFTPSGPSLEFKPIFDHYSDCVQSNVKAAIDLAGSQGGRVYLDNYIPGTEYAPFASQLNFLGGPVPYWYYVSGNGVIKENVPIKKDIENDIARYIEQKIGECNFDSFYSAGFNIDFGEPKAKVTINENSVDVVLSSKVAASKDGKSAVLNTHKVSVTSHLGKFYTLAKSI